MADNKIVVAALVAVFRGIGKMIGLRSDEKRWIVGFLIG
jgi:hypothetical protein